MQMITQFCVMVKIGSTMNPQAARTLPVPVTVNDKEVGAGETKLEAACRKAGASLSCSLDCGEVVTDFDPREVDR